MVTPIIIAIVTAMLFLLIVYLFMARGQTPYLRYNDMRKQEGVMRYMADAAVAIAPAIPPALLRQKPTSRAKLDDKINRAGNPWKVTPVEFIVLKYVFCIVGFVLGFGIFAAIGSTVAMIPWFVWPILGALAGFMVPNYVYHQKTTERDLQFKKELPEALNLLTIATSAGSTFKVALNDIVPLLKPGVVHDELSMVNDDIASGNTIVGALDNLSKRSPNVDTEAFVKSIKQAEEYGSNADITATLKSRSETNREEFNAFIENKIVKLSSQMMAILTPTLMGSLFIITLAPMLSMLSQIGLF